MSTGVGLHSRINEAVRTELARTVAEIERWSLDAGEAALRWAQENPEAASRMLELRANARSILARTDPSLFAEVVGTVEGTTRSLVQSPTHRAFHSLASTHAQLVVWAHIEAGKCLALGTLVLRADGQTARVEDMCIGDALLGPDSTPRLVTHTIRGKGAMFRIVPHKGEPWVCNEHHVLTLVHTVTGEVVDIELGAYLQRSEFWRGTHKLFQPEAVTFHGSVEAPTVSPYFLGVWLGDGTKHLHSTQVTKPDKEIEQACQEEAQRWGLSVTKHSNDTGCPTYRLASSGVGVANPLTRELRRLMPDGPRVPEHYLRGSIETRANVLAGLLDTDGFYKRGCHEIVQKSAGLAEDITFLARSLGLRVTAKDKFVVIGERLLGPYKRLRLMGPSLSSLPYRIQRKTAELPRGGKNSRRVGFVVEPVGDGEYAGFTLDGDGRFLLADFTVTHNSLQLSILRPVWELGCNPNLRIAIVSNTAGQAIKLVKAQQDYIANSAACRRVFPHLKPGSKWTDSAYSVARVGMAKDYSVQAVGVHGNVLGARLDLIVMDDVLDFENTRTPDQREALKQWVRATLLGRLTAHGRVWCVGTAWTPDDLMHTFAQQSGWAARRFPVLDEATGLPTWPEQWPLERVREKEATLLPMEAARQLHCRARSDTESRFQQAWLDRCLVRGDGFSMPESIGAVPLGHRMVTGVDLGTRESRKSDLTVLFTLLVHPDGTRQVVWVESGRWTAPDIIKRIVNTHARYHSTIFVESNAAQVFIQQFIEKKTAIPIVPFITGRNKHDPELGVESLAVELANGKWIIPSHGGQALSPDVSQWMKEMLFYDPSAHTGDRLMASWIAREGAARAPKRAGFNR